MAKFYRINEHIQAPSLRVLDSKGEQLGVLTRAEALEKAKELGLDLIEIASNANPAVAKIANFQKFRYDENKKDRGSKKSSEGGLKELWLSPRIDVHDLQVRLKRTEEFLKKGFKVKLTVKFKGREMAHQDLGYKVLQEALGLLGEKVGVDREPKMEGRKLSIIVGKNKGGNKPEEETTTESKENAKTEN